MSKVCEHGSQLHAQILRKAVARMATYPWRLCQAFAKALIEYRTKALERCFMTATAGAEDEVEGASSGSSSGGANVPSDGANEIRDNPVNVDDGPEPDVMRTQTCG